MDTVYQVVLSEVSEVALTQPQFEALHNTLLSILAYLEQIYQIGIIVPSIMLGIFILFMFYKLLTWFGR